MQINFLAKISVISARLCHSGGCGTNLLPHETPMAEQFDTQEND